MYEIKLYKSPWKALRLLLLASPFITMGFWDITHGNTIAPVWLNWFSVCFFGLAIPISLFNLFDRRPQIIINEKGIFDRMAYKDFVNWNLIKNAYPADVHGQKFICLVLDEAAIPLLKFNKKLKSLSKELGFQEVNISLGQIKKLDISKFIKFILAMTTADHTDRQLLLKQTQI